MAPLRSSQRVRRLSPKAMANQTVAAADAALKASRAAKKQTPKPAANSSAKMAPKKAAAPKAVSKSSTKRPAPKKPAATSAAPVNTEDPHPVPAPTPASKKRKSPLKLEDEEEETAEEPAPVAKKAKVAPAAKKPKAKPAPKKAKLGAAINNIPTQILDIYVFGEGSSGELGLGSVKVGGKKPIDVKRPRLNENLSAETVGVVQIAVGGMHCAALTKDNEIYTWGVNDQGALGRDTKWDGVLKDMNDDESDISSDDGDDTGMNPLESTPAAIDSKHFPDEVKFVQVAASDSATFALTEDGSVYGWGTFRSNDGILGFTEKIHIQRTPIQLPELKKITSLAAGSNHILALDQKGSVFAWGSGQQNQLGRRVVERTRLAGLVPREFGLPKGKIASISCGSYHSFAITKDNKVYSWGLNSFGETGINAGAGEDNAVIFKPTIVTELNNYDIREIDGGGHHSLACTKGGELLVWGRADGSQIGMQLSDIPKEHFIYDERDAARILKTPTVIPGINAVTVAAGSDNCFAVDVNGRAYSWGFSANFQTGQGTDDDVEVATVIENTAVKGKKIVGAAAGGQFSVLWAHHL